MKMCKNVLFHFLFVFICPYFHCWSSSFCLFCIILFHFYAIYTLDIHHCVQSRHKNNVTITKKVGMFSTKNQKLVWKYWQGFSCWNTGAVKLIGIPNQKQASNYNQGYRKLDGNYYHWVYDLQLLICAVRVRILPSFTQRMFFHWKYFLLRTYWN